MCVATQQADHPQRRLISQREGITQLMKSSGWGERQHLDSSSALQLKICGIFDLKSSSNIINKYSSLNTREHLQQLLPLKWTQEFWSDLTVKTIDVLNAHTGLHFKYFSTAHHHNLRMFALPFLILRLTPQLSSPPSDLGAFETSGSTPARPQTFKTARELLNVPPHPGFV